MNSDPNNDSEIVLSPKTSWVHQMHSLLTQPAHPGAHRRAQVCAHGRVVGDTAVSWPWPPAMWQALMAVSQGVVPCRWRCPCAVSWLGWPCRDTAASSHAPFLITIQLMYCDTILCHSSPCCHDTMTCITTNFFFSQPTFISVTIH